MGLWASLRKRRVFQFLGAYLAAGFLALEGIDQMVDHAVLPEVAWEIALILYLFGIPGTTILAWFHGERGPQRPPAVEIWLQAGLVVAAAAVMVVVIRDGGAAVDDIEAAGLDARRVAVLYFEDLSAGDELEYLADGLTEGLIDELSQVRALDVISRNGVAPYRDSELSRDSIARALEAGSLIAGVVEREGDRVRVMTRLVDGTSGVDIQRRSLELPADELLSIRDSVIRDVARFLRVRLGEEVRLRERRAGTSSTEAWALVQRAERLRKQAESAAARHEPAEATASYGRADSILAVAESLDPTWAEPVQARAGIAYRRARLAVGEDAHAFERWTETGLEHVERALELAPNDPRALELRGTLRYARWVFARPDDPAEAEDLLGRARADLEAARRIDPTLATVHSTLSHLYYQTEDLPAAVLAARRAYEEDAYLDLADQVLWRLFSGSLDLEQFGQARRWCDEGRRRFPDDFRFVVCELRLLATPAVAPDVERAWERLAALDTLAPEPLRPYLGAEGLIYTAGTIARAGLADSARSVLRRARGMVTHEVDPEQELLTVEAYVRTILGDYDEAVALLQRYAAANPGHFEGAGTTSWWWRDLQDDPRFQELIGTSVH